MDDETRRLIDASCPDVRERTVHRINSGKKAGYVLKYIEKRIHLCVLKYTFYLRKYKKLYMRLCEACKRRKKYEKCKVLIDQLVVLKVDIF